MQAGVSYFSARTLRHVLDDLRDIVDHGCTYVVHCNTETDLAYYRETMREIADATREAGLEVWFDPWGLARVFSGETLSRFPLDHPDTWQLVSDGRRVGASCPNHPKTREFLREWIDACAAAGGDVLFWDEPHFYAGIAERDFSGAWGCRCVVCLGRFHERFRHPMPPEFTAEVRAFREASLIDLLTELCGYGHEKGMRNALCLLPTDLSAHGFPGPEERLTRALERRSTESSDSPLPRMGEGRGVRASVEAMMHFGVGDFDTAAAIPDLDIFGVDPYWYIFGTEAGPFTRVYGELARDAAAKHGRDLQLWLQAFSVPESREDELRTGIRVAEELGASHIAAWSYEANASMSQLRCARPDVVWSLLGEEFRRLRSGDGRTK
jgi:hypothetical protein